MNFSSRRLLLAVFLFALSSAAFGQDFVKFGTSHDNGFWGDSTQNSPPFPASFPSALEYLAPNGRNQLTSLSLNSSNIADVFNGVYGPFDALVVSESIFSVNAGDSALFASYVNNGGCLIATSDGGGGLDDFLNGLFSYGMSAFGTNEGTDTFALQVAGAVGTAFAGGPGSLLATNATAAFSGTPGTIIYDDPSVGVGVFTVAQGLGTVVAIGFDYCCANGAVTTQQVILDWFDVIDRAFSQCGFASVPPVPVPASSPFSLIVATILLILFGVIAIRRRTLRMQI